LSDIEPHLLGQLGRVSISFRNLVYQILTRCIATTSWEGRTQSLLCLCEFHFQVLTVHALRLRSRQPSIGLSTNRSSLEPYSIRAIPVNRNAQATTTVIMPLATAQVASGPILSTRAPESGAPMSPAAPINPNV
jgi:hypothetical protein